MKIKVAIALLSAGVLVGAWLSLSPESNSSADIATFTPLETARLSKEARIKGREEYFFQMLLDPSLPPTGFPKIFASERSILPLTTPVVRVCSQNQDPASLLIGQRSVRQILEDEHALSPLM